MPCIERDVAYRLLRIDGLVQERRNSICYCTEVTSFLH